MWLAGGHRASAQLRFKPSVSSATDPDLTPSLLADAGISGPSPPVLPAGCGDEALTDGGATVPLGVQTGRTQHAKLHQLLISAGCVESLAHVRPGVRRLCPCQLQCVGTCHGAGGGGWEPAPHTCKRAAPRSTPPILVPPRPPAQSRVQGGSSGFPQSWAPASAYPPGRKKTFSPRGRAWLSLYHVTSGLG